MIKWYCTASYTYKVVKCTLPTSFLARRTKRVLNLTSTVRTYLHTKSTRPSFYPMQSWNCWPAAVTLAADVAALLRARSTARAEHRPGSRRGRRRWWRRGRGSWGSARGCRASARAGPCRRGPSSCRRRCGRVCRAGPAAAAAPPGWALSRRAPSRWRSRSPLSRCPASPGCPSAGFRMPGLVASILFVLFQDKVLCLQ